MKKRLIIIGMLISLLGIFLVKIYLFPSPIESGSIEYEVCYDKMIGKVILLREIETKIVESALVLGCYSNEGYFDSYISFNDTVYWVRCYDDLDHCYEVAELKNDAISMEDGK